MLALILTQWQDFCARSVFSAKFRPSVHQASAFIKQIAPLIGRLDFVPHDVRKRGFDDLSREIRALGRPRSECRTKTMRSDVTVFHAAQNHQQGHVRELRMTVAWKNKFVLSNGLQLV